MKDRHAAPPGKDITPVLREFVNALAKSSMYPAGHRFAIQTAEQFTEHLAVALEARGTITLGFTPRALLLDGAAIDPLPLPFRQFGQRLHRRNVGTIQLSPGISVEEVSQMLEALTAGDAGEAVGREGLRLAHVRIEPLVYEVLAFGGDGIVDQELDEVFWSRLVEAAFGLRLAEGAPVPTAAQLAAAINERATESPEGARRVFEALSAFASALAARGDRNVGSARRRFVDVLSALSRPATTRVMGAAPTRVQRRRFMRETLEQVPPALLLQLLESVAEADGEPISSHLRWLLGKLAGSEGSQRALADGVFATEIMGLMETWDGVTDESEYTDDPRLAAEHSRTVQLGLEIGRADPMVLTAARRLSERGYLSEVLQAVDQPGNDPDVSRTIAAAVLDADLLRRLISESSPDWSLVERVVTHTGISAVPTLLNGLDSSEDRTTRRRMLDLLVRIGSGAEAVLLDRLAGAEWHLTRNILAVLSQMPNVVGIERVLPLMRDPEPRVRLEALKVLLRSPTTRRQAVAEALESGEPGLVRTALASLAGSCPPELVAPVLGVLQMQDEDARMQAIRLIGDSDNPLVVGPLLALVRERGGFLRRWRLLPKSPVMLSALGVLAKRWPNHRPVLMVMQLAARSSDSEIRRTVGVHR
jgi:hypothetical protein